MRRRRRLPVRRDAGLDVLVVEDDEVVAGVIRTALSLEGHRVTVVGKASDARRAIARRRPGVVVVDVGLPDGNGIDLVRAVRAGGARPAVLVLSGFAQEATVLRALSAGADDYMTKPFSPRELVARVGLRAGGG